MAAKKDNAQASEKTQPARRAVSRRGAADVTAAARTPADVANVKTTPGRAAVNRRTPASSVADVQTTAGRAAVKRHAPSAPHEPVITALGRSARAHVLRRAGLKDTRGDEAIGYVVKADDGELCRFVLQGATLLGALVDSLRFDLEHVFEWVRPDGELLGHLTLTWKDATLVDLDDRPLCTMETGPFAELTRMSFRLLPWEYPRAFTVFEGHWQRALVDVGLANAERPVPVARNGRTWAWVERRHRTGSLVSTYEGLSLESNASFPAAHRLWTVMALASMDYLIEEYEARQERDGALVTVRRGF